MMRHGRTGWWRGVALRRGWAAPSADAPARPVALPAAWDDAEGAAAAALAALAPPWCPASLPRAVELWIGRVLARGRRTWVPCDAAGADALAEALRALVLTRRGAPGMSTWRGDDPAAAPRFVLSLPAFLEEDGGFDAPGFAAACAIAVRALDALSGGTAARLRLGFADLAGLLAASGLAYDTDEARAVGAALAAVARGAADAESGRLAARDGARVPLALNWPAPPAETAVPGLAAAARAALDAAAAAPVGLRHASLLVLDPADAAEALLGAETGGIAAAPGPTRAAIGPGGARVEVPTAAARRAGGGDRAARLLAPVGEAARAAMRDAVAPFLHAAPPVAVAPAAAPDAYAAVVGARRPIRRTALAPVAPGPLHVTVGGLRVALHRTLDAEGRLAGFAFDLPREAASLRAALDAVADAVSLGLEQGVPFSRYLDRFAYARLGPPGGAVEGDPEIRRATSVLDWAMRRLARDHLGRVDVADPPEDAEVGRPAAAAGRGRAPALPLLDLQDGGGCGPGAAEGANTNTPPPRSAATSGRAGAGRRPRARGLLLAG